MFGKSVLKIMNNCCMYPFLLFWSNAVFDLGIVINNHSQGFILLQRTVVTRKRLKLNFLGINPDIKPVYNSAILNLIYLQYDNRSALKKVSNVWNWSGMKMDTNLMSTGMRLNCYKRKRSKLYVIVNRCEKGYNVCKTVRRV